jgi:hypothetical protein
LIPVIVSGLHLISEMISGDLSRPHLAILSAWFIAAAYFQFRGGSPALFAGGIVAQVLLAIYLRFRVRLGELSK